jgi:hypothetical protein
MRMVDVWGYRLVCTEWLNGLLEALLPDQSF